MVKIIMILDESGSMNCIASNIKKAVNDFFETQRNVKIEGEEKSDEKDTFSLIKFSDIVKQTPQFHLCPISDLQPLTDQDYVPSGGTALFDAIGLTLTENKDYHDVLCVIVTDGQENASRTFKTRESIQTLISTYKAEKNWTFVYLSTDLDTFQQGTSLGIAPASASTTGSHNVVVGHDQISSFLSNQCSRGVTGYREKRGKGEINMR
jgi:hypothetical protein